MTDNRVIERQILRQRFINALYDATEADRSRNIDMWQLGGRLDFSLSDTQLVADYLAAERLIEFRADQGVIAITHRGIIEVEEGRTKPADPTPHFPPMINYLSIQSMVGSTVQQGGHAATLNATTDGNLREFVALLRDKLSSVHLPPDAASEAQSDLETLEAQSKSPKPKLSIIREALLSLRTVFEIAAGDVVAMELLARIGRLLT